MVATIPPPCPKRCGLIVAPRALVITNPQYVEETHVQYSSVHVIIKKQGLGNVVLTVYCQLKLRQIAFIVV